MKRPLGFVWTTVVSGFLIALPIVLITMVLIETVGWVEELTDSLVETIGIEEVVGFELALPLSILIVVASCFLAGLYTRERDREERRRGPWVN